MPGTDGLAAACSRRNLISRAARAGVGGAAIALVGCTSPEVCNTRDQQAPNEASAPLPEEPEPDQPPPTPVAARPAAATAAVNLGARAP